jgi:phospholipid/cholesterol/gamma-HCH transport system permease protein
MTAFLVEIAVKCVTPPFYFSAWVDATAVLVRRCMPPLLLVLLTMGAVLTVQMLNLATIIRADQLVGGVMGAFTFRELGPVIAAVLIGAQGGSFVATELGAMRIKEEFDALELMAVDPVRYAVVPRFMGFIIATPILAMMANVGGLLGAHISIAALADMTSGTFWGSVYDYMQMRDLWNGIIKSFVFSSTIALLSCYLGFHVEGGAAQVGAAANRAVVAALLAVMGMNYLVTTLLYGATGSLQRF